MRKEDDTMMRLPSFDMLWISYSGDPEGTFSMIVPYCEVYNGEIAGIDSDGVTIHYKGDSMHVPHDEFKEVIEDALGTCASEQGFKARKIRRLSVQPKDTADVIQIPITQ
jgi:hypothetical protein